MRNYIWILIFFIGTLGHSQENIFFERSFWENTPSIEEVKNNVNAVNSLTALNPNGFDALVYAILSETPNKTIKHLLKYEGNGVNKLTHDKRTYVFWAAYKGNIELMRFLIDKGARMDLKDAHHYSPLTFAAATGQTNKAIYELCMSNGIDIKSDLDERGANALLLIIPNLKNVELIDFFEEKGLSLNDLDTLGNNAINYAAYSGNIKMIEFLVSKKLAINVIDSLGNNATIIGSIGTRSGSNSLEFFQFLKGLGVKINCTNKKGVNPIHNLSYESKDLAVYRFFEENGVTIDTSDSAGNTPLINAAKYNDIEVVTYLKNNTKEINKVNKIGCSALTNAVEHNTSKIVEYLIKEGANSKVEDKSGNNLTYYLIKSYDTSQIEDFKNKFNFLLAANLNVSKKQNKNNNYLHLAVEKNDLNLLKMFQKYPVNINEKNSDGLTALHKAAMTSKDASILKYLIFIGADKNSKTDFGETAFDLAQENELLKINTVNLEFLKQNDEK
jgi:ankyrin repeat protein